MGRKAAKMCATVSRAKKKAQQSKAVGLNDSESPADIELSNPESPAPVKPSDSESPAPVEDSNVVDHNIAITKVSYYLKDSELRTHQHAHQSTFKTRKTHQPATTKKGRAQAPSQAQKKSAGESPDPEATLRVHNKPTCKSAQAVTTLCQHFVCDDYEDDLELPAVDEYDETQESDAALTTTTNTDTIVKKVTSKLAKKSKAKQAAIEVGSDLDDKDSDDKPEGKYIPSSSLRLWSADWQLEFDISMDINDSKNAKRTIETVQSGIRFYSLRDRVALILKAHPQSVELQYRFSNDCPSALPCDLTLELEFRAMVDHLRPLVIALILCNGKRSSQLFNKDNGDPSLMKGEGKVSGRLVSSHL